MGDLRDNRDRMAELLRHIRGYETGIDYFYCDSGGLVTIAYGELVDAHGGSDADGRAKAQRLARTPHVQFIRTGTNVTAAVAEVAADWQDVKTYGRLHPNSRAGRFEGVANLRLTDGAMTALLDMKVRIKIRGLYAHRAYLQNFDERVSMAFTDVLYNPARIHGHPIALFGESFGIPDLWAKIDPASPRRDFTQAVEAFRRIWAPVDHGNYPRRHEIRSNWLAAGLAATVLPAAAGH